MNRKKDKLQKNLLTAGLGLATVVAVGVATDTQAKANDTDTTNTTTTVRADTTAKELKEKVEAQEKVVVNKKAEVEELKNNVGSATKEVENLEEKAKEITPEKISEVEKVIEDKTVDLKINEEKAKSLVSAEGNKQKEVALSTTDVKVAEINLNKAKEETEKAKTDLQSAKEVLAGTNAEKVSKALEEAKRENTNAKADVEAKKTALEKAKTDDTTRQNEINKLTTQKQQAETTLTNAQTDLATKTSNYNTVNSELDTAKAKLIKAQNDVDSINRIHLTPEYVKALKKYMNIVDKEDGTLDYGNYTDEDMKSAKNELRKMNDSVLALNTYKVNKNDDNTTLLDTNNLDLETRTKLSLFASDLINQIREQMGTPKVTVTPSSLDFADKVAKEYVKDNFNNFNESDHNVEGIKKVAREYGLAEGQFYENLSAKGFQKTTKTYSQLKESVYQAVINFMLNGDEWLHAQSIAGLNLGRTQGKVGYFGVAISNVEGVETVHTIKVEQSFLDEATKNNFNTTEIPNTVTVEKLLTALETAKSNYENKVDEVKEVLQAKQQAEQLVRTTKNSLNTINTNLTNVQNTPVKTPTAQSNFDNAQRKLTTSQAALNEAQQNYDNLNADLKTKQQAVEKATTTLLEKEKAQATKQKELNEKQVILNTFVKQLGDIQKQIPETNKVTDKLKQEIKNNETELTTLKNLPQLLKNAQVKLSNFKADLTNKQTQLEEGIKLYTKLLRQQVGATIFDQKAPENRLPEAIITEVTREYIVKYNVREEFDSTLEKGKRVVKVKGKDGKRVVKLDVLTVNGQEVNSLEKEVLSEEEAVDEIVLVGTKESKVPTQPSFKGTKKDNEKKLPNTGETTSNVLGLGVVLSALSLGLYRRKQR